MSEKIFPYLHGFAFRAFPYSGRTTATKDGASGVTFSENVAPNGGNVGFGVLSRAGAPAWPGVGAGSCHLIAVEKQRVGEFSNLGSISALVWGLGRHLGLPAAA